MYLKQKLYYKIWKYKKKKSIRNNADTDIMSFSELVCSVVLLLFVMNE